MNQRNGQTALQQIVGMDALQQLNDAWKQASPRGRLAVGVLLGGVALLIGVGAVSRSAQRVDLELPAVTLSTTANSPSGSRTEDRERLEQVRKELAAAGITDLRIENGHLSVPTALAPICRKLLNTRKPLGDSWAEEWERGNLAAGQFSSSKDRETAREIARAKYVARLLRELPNVEHADVMWDEDDAGWQSPRKARATVYLKPKAGQSITPDIINAVRIAVAGSKRHLDPAHIVVLDLTRMTAYNGPNATNEMEETTAGSEVGNLEIFQATAREAASFIAPHNTDILANTSKIQLAGDIHRKSPGIKLAPRAYVDHDASANDWPPNVFDKAGIETPRKQAASTSRGTSQDDPWEAADRSAKSPPQRAIEISPRKNQANASDDWVNADAAPERPNTKRVTPAVAAVKLPDSAAKTKPAIKTIEFVDPAPDNLPNQDPAPTEDDGETKYRFQHRRPPARLGVPIDSAPVIELPAERATLRPTTKSAAQAISTSPLPATDDWLSELDAEEATDNAAKPDLWAEWQNSPITWCAGGGLVMLVLGHYYSGRSRRRRSRNAQALPEAVGPLEPLDLTDFEEIRCLPPSLLSVLLQQFPANVWVAALAGSSLETRRNVLRLLFADEADSILERLEASPPLRLRDIDEAQQKILNAARAHVVESEIAPAEETPAAYHRHAA